MTKVTGIGFALVLALGCGKSSDTSGGGEAWKSDLDALTKLKDELCACKDSACGKAVRTKIDAKIAAMDQQYASSPNKNIMHRAMETDRAARECMLKLP